MSETRKPVTIKKYANRRLYNTETSTYVTLEDLAQMVREERDFVVFDAKSGEDLTHSVLTQIILEQESRGQNLLPVNFLRQLIRFYGDSVGKLVPTYLELSIETLTREQEKFRKHMTEAWGNTPFGATAFSATPFGTAAFDAMQEQARQNMAIFEKAFKMFSPFMPPHMRAAAAEAENGMMKAAAAGEAAMGAAQSADGGTRMASADAAAGKAGEAVQSSELAVLKEQLAAMQRQLDRLSKD
ncbi:MAG: polyhydroxyalkanoate synthesis repressor PhaR [Hyphomicrobiaceae bacterium]